MFSCGFPATSHSLCVQTKSSLQEWRDDHPHSRDDLSVQASGTFTESQKQSEAFTEAMKKAYHHRPTISISVKGIRANNYHCNDHDRQEPQSVDSVIK